MHLENEKFLDTCKLIERKNRGGLTKANSNVIKVVETANQVIELMLSTKNVAEEKFLFQKLLISTMETAKLEAFSEFAKNH